MEKKHVCSPHVFLAVALLPCCLGSPRPHCKNINNKCNMFPNNLDPTDLNHMYYGRCFTFSMLDEIQCALVCLKVFFFPLLPVICQLFLNDLNRGENLLQLLSWSSQFNKGSPKMPKSSSGSRKENMQRKLHNIVSLCVHTLICVFTC